MLTTLSIDDQLASNLEQLANETGISFQQAVNNALWAGLRTISNPQTAYRLEPSSLGPPYPGLNLDKALNLADSLDDESLIRSLVR